MKKIAFTIYRNDPYLKVWLKHYSQFFDDIVVYNDNQPRDPSTDLLRLQKQYKFRIEDIRALTTNDPKFVFLTHKVAEWLREYLKTYQLVLFSMCDELIVPTSGTLGEYLEKMDSDFVRCTGYEVIQAEKNSLSLDKPILQQRTKWVKMPLFNKPLITKIPLDYVEGWHCLAGEDQTAQVGDPNLLLIHLKRADYVIFRQRYKNYNFPPSYAAENDPHTMFHQYDHLLSDIPVELKNIL